MPPMPLKNSKTVSIKAKKKGEKNHLEQRREKKKLYKILKIIVIH
jgi:hypothetical protein